MQVAIWFRPGSRRRNHCRPPNLAIYGPFFITSCNKGAKSCELTTNCTIKEPLARVNDTIAGVLKSISIQDLAEHESHAEQAREAQKLVALTI